MPDHFLGAVGPPVGRQRGQDGTGVIAEGQQGRLGARVSAVLGQAHSSRQTVAQAHASNGVTGISALGYVVERRLAWAAVAERAVGLSVGRGQVAEVAAPPAVRVP